MIMNRLQFRKIVDNVTISTFVMKQEVEVNIASNSIHGEYDMVSIKVARS